MKVKDFLNVFSSGSVVFRLNASDGSYPIVCSSDVYAREYDNISALYSFNLLDCIIVDIISTRDNVHVFIDEIT